MTISIYKDLENTVPLAESSFFIGNGKLMQYAVLHDIAEVYLNSFRTSNYSVLEKTVFFNSPPQPGTLVTIMPRNSLLIYLTANIVNNSTATLYITTTEAITLLSENVASGAIGELLLSEDGVSFSSCISLAPVTNKAIQVKAAVTVPLEEIKNVVANRLVIITSDLAIDANGNVSITFSPLGGQTGGVEIYEILI